MDVSHKHNVEQNQPCIEPRKHNSMKLRPKWARLKNVFFMDTHLTKAEKKYGSILTTAGNMCVECVPLYILYVNLIT